MSKRFLTPLTLTSVSNDTGDLLTISGSGIVSRRSVSEILSDIGAAASGHNHTLDSLSNVTITSNSDGELLRWHTGSSAWINNTLAEAGIAAVGHAHAASDITSGTLTVEQGGTGLSSVTTNSYVKGAGTGNLVPRTYSEVKTDLALNNVENTALSTWVGTSSITTVGTIGTGTWQGSTIGVGYGGTGIASYTANNYIRASGATTLEQRTPEQVLSDISAVPTSRTVSSGTGLAGGGALSSNQTLSLSEGSISSLALADTAIQPTTPTGINAQTGTSYTLAVTDINKLVTLSNEAAITLTVPPNGTAAFAVGSTIVIQQLDEGDVTIVAGDGVTVNDVTDDPVLTLSQWQAATLVKLATNTWALVGGGSEGGGSGSADGISYDNSVSELTATDVQAAIDEIVANALTLDDLGDSATLDVGTSAGTVAAGDHNHSLDSLSNVTITSNSSGELLKWSGSAWINNTLAEAGIAAVGHAHAASDITSGTLTVEQGGTGLATVATNSYLKGAGTGNLVPRTYSEVKTDLSLGNVENTALSTWAGTTNITTLGTIASGTWQGTTIGVAYGGTGIASYTTNNYIRASGATTLQQRTPSEVLSDISGVPTSRTVSSGTGLTGGGALSSNQTISLSSGSIASLELADTAIQPTTPTGLNAQTGTSYTLALTDINKVVTLSNTDAIALTVPPNDSIALPVGATIAVQQIGVGAVTISGGSGVTVNGITNDAVLTLKQWQGATLVKLATNTWALAGGGNSPSTIISGQSGGSNGGVVRYSSANTWTNASQEDTIAQLTGVVFKQGDVYYAPGSYITGLSSLTAGSVYYLSTGGGITTTPPTPSGSIRLLVIGKAVSTTTLLFAPGIPIGG